MNSNFYSNEKPNDNSSFKQDSNINLNNKSENKNEKFNDNNQNNKVKNKLSSFNNIQISSNNNNDNSNKGISYTYISDDKKQKSNFQISSINNSNNKFSNNKSHQGISFIAKNNKEDSKKFQISTKINSQEQISYIAPENKNKKKENSFSIESNNFSETSQKGINYSETEKPKNKVFQITSNSYKTQLNETSKGICYISNEKSKLKDNQQKLEIISNSNKNPQDIINYIAPKYKNANNYIIENNPTNNKQNQNGISYIAPNKPKNNWTNNSNISSHQEINYISSKYPKTLNYEITSNNTNNNINNSGTQISYIPKMYKKPINYQLSTQNNTYTYIAPGKIDSSNKNKEQKIMGTNNGFNKIKNDFEISSNNNNFVYISKNKEEKKQKPDDFKFNHNESMTFICEDKKIPKDNLFMECGADKFKYIKDEATGAQILEQENN